MTTVEDPWVGGTPGRSGDLVWYPADDDRGFDPVTDIAITDRDLIDADWIAAIVEHCAQGLALLERIDPSGSDDATVTAWATGVEQLRRQSEAAAIAVTEHLDTAQPFRDQGFFTAKAWMKHRLQLSGAEAYGLPARRSCCSNRPASGRAATNPTPGATPIT